jgi:copper chaperone CopZ
MTCAYAVRVALKKFAGVESVDVSLNKGLATVKLQPGNTLEPQQFWDAVRKNGFTPKETRVVVRGEVTNAARPQFQVAGTNEVFELKGNGAALDEAKHAAGKPVIVDGSLLPGKDVKQPVPLDIRAVRSGI